MKYNNLYTFGCSYTFGEFLDNKYPSQFPSIQAWPNCLATKLKCDLYNYAYPGSSNKEILDKILNTTFLKNSFVIIHWTYFTRYAILKDLYHKDIIQLGTWIQLPNKLDYTGENKFRRSFVETCANEDGLFDLTLDSILRINYARLFLNTQKITNIHFIMEHNLIKKYPIWHDSSINNNLTINDIYKNFPLAEDNLHPGIKAHSTFAKQVHKYLKNTKLLS